MALTPEPWVDCDSDDCTHPIVSDRDFGETRVISRDDYARACAAVNACVGMPTAALEVGVVHDLLAAVNGLLDGLDANVRGECEGLSQQQWDARVKAAQAAVARAEGRA